MEARQTELLLEKEQLEVALKMDELSHKIQLGTLQLDAHSHKLQLQTAQRCLKSVLNEVREFVYVSFEPLFTFVGRRFDDGPHRYGPASSPVLSSARDLPLPSLGSRLYLASRNIPACLGPKRGQWLIAGTGERSGERARQKEYRIRTSDE
eukprot:150535-Prorocentrum_minimum.AAC.1